MVVKTIELNNFRIYKGRHIIDLSLDADKNIYVVSGKNGFGKTTFLMSLVWCLYGRQMQDVDELYKREIDDQGGYPKYIANSLNRQAREEEGSTFSVRLIISDAVIPELTCSEISITRSYNTLTSLESLEILIDGNDNELVRELSDGTMRGEETFIRDYLLPIEIAKFFFFDAEKIVSLAEVNTVEQRRRLSKAYSEILGIKKYEDTKLEIEETRLRLRKLTATAKEQSQFDTLETDISNDKREITSNDAEIDALLEKRTELKFLSDELQKKLVRAGDLITEDELVALRVKGTELEARMKEVQDELAKSYDVVPFAIAANLLSETTNQIKQESDYKERSFDEESAEDKVNAVLNELLDEQKKCRETITWQTQKFYSDTIERLIRKHFFPDTPVQPEAVELLHDISESEKNGLNSLLSTLRISFREQFRLLTSQYNQTRDQQQQVRRRIQEAESSAENDIVRADRDEKASLDAQVEHIDRQIGGLQLRNTQLQNDIAQKEKQRSELGNRLRVSAADRAKDQLSGELAKRLGEFIKTYKERKKESLEERILAGLHLLMHKQDFVSKVVVDIVGDTIDIDLLDKHRQKIPKQSLSKGEQQLYATALLYGLVEESDIKFPIFIDSPMQKFDDRHASNIVRHFYPSIADQVILFPLINKELTETEYQMLLPNVARAYLIVNHGATYSDFTEVPPAELFARHNALNLD